MLHSSLLRICAYVWFGVDLQKVTRVVLFVTVDAASTRQNMRLQPTRKVGKAENSQHKQIRFTATREATVLDLLSE